MMETTLICEPSYDEGWVRYVLVTSNEEEIINCLIEPNTGDCAALITEDAYRLQGYCQYFLSKLIDMDLIKYLQVEADNHIAFHIYTKLGFTVEKAYDLDGVKYYSMVLTKKEDT